MRPCAFSHWSDFSESSVFLKKFGRDSLGRAFVSHRLRAVFAKFGKRAMLFRVSPRAGLTVDSAFLIELEQSARAAHDAHFAESVFQRAGNRADAGGGVFYLADFQVSDFVGRFGARIAVF
jgi:hypothetical protein